jgi:hypothetical protein
MEGMRTRAGEVIIRCLCLVYYVRNYSIVGTTQPDAQLGQGGIGKALRKIKNK